MNAGTPGRFASSPARSSGGGVDEGDLRPPRSRHWRCRRAGSRTSSVDAAAAASSPRRRALQRSRVPGTATVVASPSPAAWSRRDPQAPVRLARGRRCAARPSRPGSRATTGRSGCRGRGPARRPVRRATAPRASGRGTKSLKAAFWQGVDPTPRVTVALGVHRRLEELGLGAGRIGVLAHRGRGVERPSDGPFVAAFAGQSEGRRRPLGAQGHVVGVDGQIRRGPQHPGPQRRGCVGGLGQQPVVPGLGLAAVAPSVPVRLKGIGQPVERLDAERDRRPVERGAQIVVLAVEPREPLDPGRDRGCPPRTARPPPGGGPGAGHAWRRRRPTRPGDCVRTP